MRQCHATFELERIRLVYLRGKIVHKNVKGQFYLSNNTIRILSGSFEMEDLNAHFSDLTYAEMVPCHPLTWQQPRPTNIQIPTTNTRTVLSSIQCMQV
jgi:hypothetical protein